MQEPVPKRLSTKMTEELRDWLDRTQERLGQGVPMAYSKQLKLILTLLRNAYPDGLDEQWGHEMTRREREAENRRQEPNVINVNFGGKR